VEFKPGRCLFVLLTYFGADHANRIMRQTMNVSYTHEGLRTIMNDREVRSISFEKSPSIFVCDIGKQPNDSNAEFFENLAVTKLETGFQVKLLTIQVTAEPRTIGKVESVLPWMGNGQVVGSLAYDTLNKNVQTALFGLVARRNWD
jgi:hypothetical protein